MEASPSSPASPRRTFDLPKSSADAGLAAWTSKIKAIQQEVDQDEEAEQRRLQEEIERSRLERAKRRNTATGSIDWTKAHTTGSIDDGRSDNIGRRSPNPSNRLDAIRKLSGSSTSVSPGASPKLTSAEPISLAAFIGGRASGPRLNKHAPQADSYNAALYDQERPNAPHPIFGRPISRVASGTRLAVDSGTPESHSQRLSSPTAREFSTEKSSQLTKKSEKTETVNIDAQDTNLSKTGNLPPVTASKPQVVRKLSEREDEKKINPESPSILPSSMKVQPTSASSDDQQPSLKVSQYGTKAANVPQRPISLAESMGGRASVFRPNKPSTTGDTDGVTSSSAGNMTQGYALPGLSSSERSNSPSAISLQAANDKSMTSPKHGSTIVTQSLARPAEPKLVVPPSVIPAASTMPSPAFLRSLPSTQDLHPSLTRLKGRGFVEQRVRASSQLYTADTPEPVERSATASPSSGRRPSVLDRWQPTAASTTPPPTPPSVTPQGKKLIGSRELPGLTSGLPSRQAVKSQASREQVKLGGDQVQQETTAPVRLPGLAVMPSLPTKERGSDNTPVSILADDGKAGDSREKTSMAAKPLSHPTKDRARKPQKQSSSSKAGISSTKPDDIGRDNIPHPSIPTMVNSDTVKEVDNPKITTSSFSIPEKDASTLQNIQQLKNVQVTETPIVPPPLEQRQAYEITNNQVIEVSAPRPSHPISPIGPQTSFDEMSPIPSRHPRSSSTGQRATVMDVAQALLEHEQHVREASWTPEPEEDAEPEDGNKDADELPRTDVKSLIAGWGRNRTSPSTPRRSSYDRFAVPTLPPLVEVQTPAETPQTSISRVSTQIEQQPVKAQEIHQTLKALTSLVKPIIERAADEEASAIAKPEESQPTLEGTTTSAIAKPEESQPTLEGTATVPALKREVESEVNVKPGYNDDMVIIEYEDKVPPAFNLQAILKDVPSISNTSSQTISVEVLSISGSVATPVTKEPNVFYDGEVVVIVHRAKDKKDGLVTTNVWVWRDRNRKLNEKEEKKVHELAKRFGTIAVYITHGAEPANLIHILGGVLAVRQGDRAHWSAENTAMYRIHRVWDSIFVDEVDLAIWNLCSAYSYVVSILDTVYVWHGHGSSDDERSVALAYAHSLKPVNGNVVKFKEGEEDETFWLMLGEDDYASAHHWRFRNQLDQLGARLYAIDASKTKAPVQLLPNISAVELADSNVIVVDCRLEIFILVMAHARGKRTDIQLGLFLAQNICAANAHKRPFDPPIHVVILPSKLPLELRAALRLCSEETLNGGSVPDHMNVLPLPDALDHMQRRSWPRSLLSDPSFLPLGLDPSMI